MRHERAGGVEPARVGAGEFHDRPVAAKHETVRAEGGQYVVHVRPEVVDGPSGVIGLGDEAGEFAVYVGSGGQCRDMPAPWLEQAGLDVGLAKVVEDEAGAGAGGDESLYGGQLVMPAAQVEAQARGAEGAHTSDELRPHAEIRVDFALDQVADAAHERIFLQP